MQVHPIKPTLKAPGIKLLKLKYDKPVSRFAFNLNLRRYNKGEEKALKILTKVRTSQQCSPRHRVLFDSMREGLKHRG